MENIFGIAYFRCIHAEALKTFKCINNSEDLLHTPSYIFGLFHSRHANALVNTFNTYAFEIALHRAENIGASVNE